MKLNKIIVSTVSIVLICAISCKDDFLEVLPTASITTAQLTSKAGLEGSVISAYAMLHGRGGFYAGSTNWLWGSILGGEANKGTNSGDQAQVNEIQAYDPQTTNNTVFEKYTRLLRRYSPCEFIAPFAA